MRKLIVFLGVFGLAAAGTSYAVDHSEMHEMMMKQGGPKPDDRIELKLPATMKVMQKNMMRTHLNTISEITFALASNDLNKAAKLAKGNLGWSPAEEKRCTTVSEISGEKDFLTFGMAVHKKADELADNATAGNRDKALVNLSELIKNCNACHDRFRH